MSLNASPRSSSDALCGIVASLDRKRLEANSWGAAEICIRGVFDKESRRKPLAFAADAGDPADYGI
jgi:hypothetical protein